MCINNRYESFARKPRKIQVGDAIQAETRHTAGA
jgi:hypothetical protein